MRELGSEQPTAVELEILRVLWELGPSPVREIHARLNALALTKRLRDRKAAGLSSSSTARSPAHGRANQGRRSFRDSAQAQAGTARPCPNASDSAVAAR